jgi:hypothetical protein
MTAIVRRDDQYVAAYTLKDDRYRFVWTTDINRAAEYSDAFAELVARKVGGKTLPLDTEEKRDE